MPFVNDFLSQFNSDISRPNRFQVLITPPKGIETISNVNSRDLIFSCETAELPSITYATTEQKFGSNPVEKYPYQVSFNDITLTFIVKDTMNEKLFFDAWMEKIAPSNNYNINYKSDYAGSIIINKFSVQDKLTYSVNLVEAYPISVNQLDLDWSEDGYHKLSVVFAYTYWQKI
jgi:hypothetical protein